MPEVEKSVRRPDGSKESGAGSGLGARLGLHALDYRIPDRANRWPYFLGGLTAIFLLLLVLSGLYLDQFYDPTTTGARDSVLYIISRAPLGDWIRSLHYWSAGGLTLTLVAHLAHVFWRRSYRPPRELTWWAGVGMAGLVFLLLVTGTVLRYDQEGYEALAHLVAGGELVGSLGTFFTREFTLSTSLLSRIHGFHTSLLPLALGGLAALHFWLIRHLGINAPGPGKTRFRRHARRLAGAGLLATALVGLLAVLLPEGIGYAPVEGVEVTKPFWPLLWVYGLENFMGMWGMVLGPAGLFTFLLAVPFLDRGPADGPGRHGPLGVVAAILAAALLGLWLYGAFGPTQQHIGM